MEIDDGIVHEWSGGIIELSKAEQHRFKLRAQLTEADSQKVDLLNIKGLLNKRRRIKELKDQLTNHSKHSPEFYL